MTEDVALGVKDGLGVGSGGWDGGVGAAVWWG